MSVYYLPTRPTEEPVPTTSEWPSLSVRLRNAWWRLRLAIMEIRGILRSQPRYTVTSQYDLFSEVAPPARPARPARVIDFEQARQRLRPAGLPV